MENLHSDVSVIINITLDTNPTNKKQRVSLEQQITKHQQNQICHKLNNVGYNKSSV